MNAARSGALWIGALAGLVAPLFTAPVAAQEKGLEAELVLVRKGDIPIILTAPHGGRLPIPGAPARKGEGIGQFVVARDENTAELTERLAEEIAQRLGGRPYVIVARFERKFADANRPAKDAFESPKAKPIYDAYHKAVADAREDVIKRWGTGLLLDVHGQGRDAAALMRGTNDGKTVKHLLALHGKDALTGPDSVFGRFAKAGRKVIPANDSDDAEVRALNGGYTVRHYGSADGGKVDAIQLELGSDLRAAKNRERVSADLADAVTAFARKYLPQPKNAKNPN